MAKLLFLVISALALTFVSADSSCTITPETLEKDVMECVAHDPSLMLQIIEHMKNPSALANMKFVCSHQHDLIDLIMCMTNKMVSCYPDYAAMLKQFLPPRDTWQRVFKFACDHRDDLSDSTCMQSQAQELGQCYTNKVMSIAEPTSVRDAKAIFCSMLRQIEECVRTYHGSCTQKYVDLSIQLLDMFLPKDGCPVASVDLKNQGPLGSILVHGQPLRFQPQGQVQYRYGVHN